MVTIGVEKHAVPAKVAGTEKKRRIQQRYIYLHDRRVLRSGWLAGIVVMVVAVAVVVAAAAAAAAAA